MNVSLRFNSSHVIKTRLKQKRQGAAADGARCPAYGTPVRRFCLSPESLGRVVDEVVTTRVGGASCPVRSSDLPFLRKSSFSNMGELQRRETFIHCYDFSWDSFNLTYGLIFVDRERCSC